MTTSEPSSGRATRTLGVAVSVRDALLDAAFQHRKTTGENKPYKAFTDNYIRRGLERSREAVAAGEVYPPAEALIAHYEYSQSNSNLATIVLDAALANDLDETLLVLRRNFDTVISRRALAEFYLMAGLTAAGIGIVNYVVPQVLSGKDGTNGP
jgi:hypothetical protein